MTTKKPVVITSGEFQQLQAGDALSPADCGIVSASTSTAGIVQLSNSYSGTSTTSAATEKAITDGLATKAGTTTASTSTAGLMSTSQVAILNSTIYNSKIELINEILSGRYCTVSNIKGLWVFDPTSGTTIYDRSGNSHNFTSDTDVSGLSPAISGLCPNINFSGSHYFDTPDNDDFSFGNGTVDSAFSIIALVNPNSLPNNGQFFAKYDETAASTKREYEFQTYTNYLYLWLYDNSSDGFICRLYNILITSDIGTWHTYIGTYSGNSNTSGIKIYRDGVRVDNEDYRGGSYVAMENLGAKAGNYYTSPSGVKVTGDFKAGVIAVIKQELTATQVKQLSDRLLAYAGLNLLS